MRVEYVIYIDNLKWGSSRSLNEAEEKYREVKESNSDCYISLIKVTEECIQSEFIE